jgi:PKD repeat protein
MGKVIQFTDVSTHISGVAITDWAWDFGDGNTSTSENPTNDYDESGTYDVQLMITDADGNTDYIIKQLTIDVPVLTAIFSDSITHLAATFTDHSTPGPSGPITDWDWDFGDGGTSTSENPSHTYSAPGTYEVTLTVTGTGSDGTAEVTHTVIATSAATLSAIFSSAILSDIVSFTDHSTPGASGPITAWSWDFDDGTTSTTENPTHKYTESGTYTVTLTVTGTGGDGTDDVSHDITVTVPAPPDTSSIFTQFLAHSSFARETFTPTRIVRFKDKTTFDAALADMQAGDLIKYDPNSFGLSNRVLNLGAYSIRSKSMSRRTVIDLGCSNNVWDHSKITPNYVSFSTVSGDAVLFADNKNLDIWGGFYHSDHGSGFRLMGNNTDCNILDIYCFSVGGSGVMVQPIDSHTGDWRTHDGLVIRAEINRFCMDPATDPHGDKGTGNHGAIHHGACGKLDNCNFYYYAHDSLRPGEMSFGTLWPQGGGGSACEPGTDTNGSTTSQNNNHYVVYGENLLMQPMHGTVRNPGSTISQTAGNVIDAWGSVPMNGNVFDFVGGKNITGGVFHGTGGGWGPSASPAIKVLVGRGEHTNQYVGPGGNTAERYVSGKSVDYVDCT